MINKRKAFIVGIKGHKLSFNEIKFLKKYRPWGIILFSRNIKSIYQTQLLTKKIRSIFKDDLYPILIDEEGGKVSRLNRFIDNSIFSAKFFGNLFLKDKKKFIYIYKIYINQISNLLKLLGININTVPVLDLFIKNSHKIISDRSFSSNPNVVSTIGNLFIEQFHKNGIGTVIKHIPGHGHSKVDSHFKLPIIKNNLKYLMKNDFHSFKKKNSLFSMTAHIIYNKIDIKYPATHSRKIIKLIRNKIGYNNILLSDDISMKALKFSITKNTTQAFTAGCNIVMHCNGKLKEMTIVANNSPRIDNFILKKTYQFYDIIS